jgi:hypothetical protein
MMLIETTVKLTASAIGLAYRGSTGLVRAVVGIIRQEPASSSDPARRDPPRPRPDLDSDPPQADSDGQPSRGTAPRPSEQPQRVSAEVEQEAYRPEPASEAEPSESVEETDAKAERSFEDESSPEADAELELEAEPDAEAEPEPSGEVEPEPSGEVEPEPSGEVEPEPSGEVEPELPIAGGLERAEELVPEPGVDPHHVLNTPVGEPDPTEWPDPYDHREDPRDPLSSENGESDSHPPTGSRSTSAPHPREDPEAFPTRPSERDRPK